MALKSIPTAIALVLGMLIVAGWVLDYTHVKGYMPQSWDKYYCMGRSECLKLRQRLTERPP